MNTVSTEEKHASIKLITDNAQRLYQWNYTRERPQLIKLYNTAMASQWNSVTDLDWATDVDPEGLVDRESPFMAIVRAAADEPGSPIASWGDTEFTQIGIENLKATLSQFMHGEQGAMIVWYRTPVSSACSMRTGLSARSVGRERTHGVRVRR